MLEVEIYDVEDLATIIKSSTRHVRRMNDSGAIPPPVRIGRLLRWRKADIDEWLAAGCPSCRSAKRGAR